MKARCLERGARTPGELKVAGGRDVHTDFFPTVAVVVGGLAAHGASSSFREEIAALMAIGVFLCRT